MHYDDWLFKIFNQSEWFKLNILYRIMQSGQSYKALYNCNLRL